jgi:hypothetical protein
MTRDGGIHGRLVRTGPDSLAADYGPIQPNMGVLHESENEWSDPAAPVVTTDAEQFDSALDVGVADDGALDNSNSDT